MTTVEDSFRDREILVTGVTGFLGKVWTCFLLDHLDAVGRIHLVVRGKGRKSAQQRFERIVERSPAFRPLRAKYGTQIWRFVDDKVVVHEGDCARAGLGMAGIDTLVRRLDAVVHFAGLTDFQPDPAQGLATNVEGAVHAADLAARLDRPRLIQISTSFVAGNVSGSIAESITPGITPTGVPFDPAVELARAWDHVDRSHGRAERIARVSEQANALGWPNIYTFTKALAEQLLVRRSDLALTLVRPAIVESALSYPFVGWNEGVNTSGPIVWLMASWFRRLPANPEHHFDVVPVDIVARSITLAVAAALRDQAAPVYQVASSSLNPLTFGRAVDLNALAYRRRYAEGHSLLDRRLKRYFDGVFESPDEGRFPSMSMLRNGARELLDLLTRLDPKEFVSASYYERKGPDLERRRRSAAQAVRNADRTMKRIEEMLKLYRPFIHDNDYVFVTERLRQASAELSPDDRETFGFNIEDLCWRKYWLDVHVPGLEAWSLPMLRGERVPEDPPFAVARTETTVVPSLAEGA